MREPIFIFWTRSFWAAVMTAGLTVSDMGEPAVRALVTLWVSILGGDVDQLTATWVDILPVFTLIVALQQRSGAARPYSLDPRQL